MIEDALVQRTLKSGHVLALIPLTFGRLRLTIGYGEDTYERGW